MSIVLMYAGETGPLTPLVDALREIYDEQRLAVINELARRKVNNAPADSLVDPGPFIDRPELAGIKVQFRIVSERQRRMLEAQHAVGGQAFIDAKDAIARADGTDAMWAAMRALIAATLVKIDGVDFRDPGVERIALSEEDLEALEKANLIRPLFAAAKAFQELPAKKALRSSQSRASTSAASTAESAPRIAAPAADAKAGPAATTAAPAISRAPGSPTTPVLAVT